MAILVSTLLLGGCLMQLAYNNADHVIAWEVDGYFNLDRDQKSFIRKRVREHLEWHREEVLGQYSEWLEETRTRVARGLREDDVDWFMNGLFRFREQLVNAVADDAARFLATITDQQLHHLYAEFEAHNREEVKYMVLDTAEKAERRTETMVDIIERWVGRLDREQRGAVARISATFPDTHARWFTYQRTRQAIFEKLVIRARHGENIVEPLRMWMLMRSADRFPEFQRAVKRTVISLDKLITSRQRQHFLGELAGLRDTLAGLHRVSPSTTDAQSTRDEVQASFAGAR
jgi:hypothetical protein